MVFHYYYLLMCGYYESICRDLNGHITATTSDLEEMHTMCFLVVVALAFNLEISRWFLKQFSLGQAGAELYGI